jgi:hypothetical protein
VVSSPVVKRPHTERASVTAETALVLPVLVGLGGILVWLIAVGIAQVQCVDAARDAARALARDEPRSQVVAAAEAMAPDGAKVVVEQTGDRVEVRVSYRATPPGEWFDAVALSLGSTSVLPAESGDGP